jgi:hypothetical protein
MSRVASPFTLAVWEFLQSTKGQGTYAEFRTAMAKRKEVGIVAEPGEATEDYKKLVTVMEKMTAPNFKDEKAVATFYAEACTKAGLVGKAAKTATEEAETRRAYKGQSNFYNVTKSNWSKNHGKSTKPVKAAKPTKTGKPMKARVVRQPKGAQKSTMSEAEAYEFIANEVGGIAAAKARMDAISEELTKLTESVALVESMQTKLNAAAA